MTIINFLSPLLSMGANWLLSPLRMASLFLEGIIYELVAYAYKLFTLMTRLNFNSIGAIMGPLISRMKAIIMVLIVFKLGMELISMLLNPDAAFKKGKDLLINVMVTACLLVTYSWIFSVINEVGMLFVGAPTGYNFPTLSTLTGASITENEGIINRFVFGNNDSIEKMGDMGEYMAYQVASIFIINKTDENVLENTIIKENGSYGFLKLPNLEAEVDRKIDYTPLFGILIGGYLVFVFFSLAAEVGIRMFKLLVLQMLAPLAIITIINDGIGKNGFTGTMGQFVKTYTSVFTQLFIRIVCTLAVTVFIGKFTTNLETYFSTALSLSDNLLTKGLLTVIVIYAGYKFVLEAPKLIDSIFKTNLSGSKGDAGFGGVVGGALLGGVTGLATGVVGGYRSGAGEGTANKLSGALAGGLTGMATGGWTGATKGNTIADKFKNMKTVNDASAKRSADWNARGGYGNVFLGGLNDISGRTKYQDKKMAAYSREEEKIKAFEKAQTDAIKNDKVSRSDMDAVFGSGSSVYHNGAETIKYGEDRDTFVQQIIQYDADAVEAQQKYDDAIKSGDTNAIMEKRSELAQAKATAEANAKRLYDHKRNNASGDSVDKARLEVNRAQRDTVTVIDKVVTGDTKVKKNETLDINAERKRIEQRKADIQGSTGYKVTHQKKDK